MLQKCRIWPILHNTALYLHRILCDFLVLCVMNVLFMYLFCIYIVIFVIFLLL